MPYKSKEAKAAYMKEYRLKNKEKIAAQRKEYMKEYRLNNKEMIAAKNKEYNQTYEGKKSHVISDWKRSGLICEDYDSLYCHYMNATHCDECGCKFGKYGDGTGTFKCMDHCHETGLFRDFLCNTCNVKRG